MHTGNFEVTEEEEDAGASAGDPGGDSDGLVVARGFCFVLATSVLARALAVDRGIDAGGLVVTEEEGDDDAGDSADARDAGVGGAAFFMVLFDASSLVLPRCVFFSRLDGE